MRERYTRIVEQVEASGLSIRQFCEVEGAGHGERSWAERSPWMWEWLFPRTGLGSTVRHANCLVSL
jgi:hypothetical protein